MFEKLLLAGTITFSLNLFIGMSVHVPSQPTVSTQATTAQATAPQPTHQPIYLAKALHDSPFLRGLFQ